MLAAIICVGVAKQEIWSGSGKKKIALDLPLLIDSNFAAGAAMIRSVTALISKILSLAVLAGLEQLLMHIVFSVSSDHA